MKNLKNKIITLIMIACLALSCSQQVFSDMPEGISIYPGNPFYWQSDGEPWMPGKGKYEIQQLDLETATWKDAETIRLPGAIMTNTDAPCAMVLVRK